MLLLYFNLTIYTWATTFKLASVFPLHWNVYTLNERNWFTRKRNDMHTFPRKFNKHSFWFHQHFLFERRKLKKSVDIFFTWNSTSINRLRLPSWIVSVHIVMDGCYLSCTLVWIESSLRTWCNLYGMQNTITWRFQLQSQVLKFNCASSQNCLRLPAFERLRQ